MNTEKYLTLIDSTNKEYVHPVKTKDGYKRAHAEYPILLSKDATVLDVVALYPGLDMTNIVLIEVGVSRKIMQKNPEFGGEKQVFTVFPRGGEPCPICNTKEDGKTGLIYKAGTAEGKTGIGIPVHIDCLLKNLVLYPVEGLIAAQIQK